MIHMKNIADKSKWALLTKTKRKTKTQAHCTLCSGWGKHFFCEMWKSIFQQYGIVPTISQNGNWKSSNDCKPNQKKIGSEQCNRHTNRENYWQNREILQTKRSNKEERQKNGKLSTLLQTVEQKMNKILPKWSTLKQERRNVWRKEGEIENAFDIENLRKNGRTFEKEKRQRNEVNSSIKQRNAKMKSLCWEDEPREGIGTEREKWKRLHLLVVNSSNSFCLSHSQTLLSILCFIVQQNFLRIYPFCSAFLVSSSLHSCAVVRDRRAQVYTSTRSERKHTFQCLFVRLSNCIWASMIFLPIAYHMHFTGYFIDMWSLDSSISPALLLYALCELVCLVLWSNDCCISKCWFSSNSSNGILLHVWIRFFLSLPPLWLLLAAIGVQHSTYSSFTLLLKSQMFINETGNSLVCVCCALHIRWLFAICINTIRNQSEI